MRFHFLSCFLMLLLNSSTRAAQVSWGTEAASIDLDSTGKPLDASYIFELGAFTPGFTPTTTNVAQWSSQWTRASRVAYDSVNKAVSGPRYVFTSNAGAFATTNRGWIWGYNPHSANGEWVLIGNSNWRWPSTTDPFSLPVTWAVVNTNTTILGSLHTSTVQMRTARVVTAVPPKLSFTAWQALYFSTTEFNNPTLSSATADADNDHIPNGIEFLLGTPPRHPNPLNFTILPRQGVELQLAATAEGILNAEISNGSS